LTKKSEIFICVFKITEKSKPNGMLFSGGTPGNWEHPQFGLLENSRPNGLLFSGELMETGGINNSGYWKIAGLAACYFQENSWKLGASIIREIGNF